METKVCIPTQERGNESSVAPNEAGRILAMNSSIIINRWFADNRNQGMHSHVGAWERGVSALFPQGIFQNGNPTLFLMIESVFTMQALQNFQSIDQ